MWGFLTQLIHFFSFPTLRFPPFLSFFFFYPKMISSRMLLLILLLLFSFLLLIDAQQQPWIPYQVVVDSNSHLYVNSRDAGYIDPAIYQLDANSGIVLNTVSLASTQRVTTQYMTINPINQNLIRLLYNDAIVVSNSEHPQQQLSVLPAYTLPVGDIFLTNGTFLYVNSVAIGLVQCDPMSGNITKIIGTHYNSMTYVPQSSSLYGTTSSGIIQVNLITNLQTTLLPTSTTYNSIAVDYDLNRIYVCNTNTIFIYNLNGIYLSSFGNTTLTSPISLAVDPTTHYLFVVDLVAPSNHVGYTISRIVKFDSNQNVLMILESPLYPSSSSSSSCYYDCIIIIPICFAILLVCIVAVVYKCSKRKSYTFDTRETRLEQGSKFVTMN